ncbi:hypothetical protein [Bradyrhizobium guangzhouense]|uniref:hypothetical protein n=1 Tax=Bradyrhizobium guangzhouense TaxID=1325095 RepID=UPI001009AF2C|nr:hypothetical protein [Bradyrhizobium guangzhouense]RXH13938.1 hypothetical protein EAS54_22840 [Bradyrhizobium guangzhouense]
MTFGKLYELKKCMVSFGGDPNIREPDIVRLLSLPVFPQEKATMEGRNIGDPHLAAWFGKIRTGQP